MSNLVIAIQGVKSEKVVNSRRKNVIPFVGADREGRNASLGIGLIFPDEQKATIHGTLVPHALIRSWRAMKILEQLEYVGADTLHLCFEAGCRRIHPNGEEAHLELAVLFGGADKLRAVRDEILASVPSVDELDTMITNLREKDVDVDYWELQEEIVAGRITTSPLIETLAHETEERKRAYEQEKEEMLKLIPHEESVKAFFEDLGIENFVAGGGDNWRYKTLNDVDLKLNCKDTWFPLEHRTAGPERFDGEIEQPWCLDTDGFKYTFVSLKWVENHFRIKIKVEEAGKTVFEDYPIQIRTIRNWLRI